MTRTGAAMPDLIPAYAQPRKTALGAHLLTRHDETLSAHLRRLLLLVNGERSVAELGMLLPAEDVGAELAALHAQAFIEHGPIDAAQPEALPRHWRDALDFMRACARSSLGVQAVSVIESINRVQDAESLHAATHLWYRALRDSRGGRAFADRARLHAGRLLKE